MINSLKILLFIFTTSLYILCTCPPYRLSDHQKEEIENSEYIFIGEVININNSKHTYKIKVLESFDNCSNKGTIYNGKNWPYCYPYIDSKGKWLIYGNIEEGFLRVNLCGISRSFENPQEVISSIPQPPLKENESKKEYNLRRKKWKKEDRMKSKQDLEQEVKNLRNRFN